MSSQVGSGHISIFPVMKGFKSQVSRDVKSAGKASASEFASSMKGAGKAAGDRVGRDLKSAVNASAGNLGASALKGMNREVATASAALSKARLKQQDEAGKVRVAEVRLQEAIEKSGAGSARAVAAEERLSSARRSHKAASDAVASASSRLAGAQDAVKNATAAAGGAADQARGKFGGFLDSVTVKAKSAGNALLNGLKSAAERVGAVIKGAATAGVAAAGAGLGIALVAGFNRLSTIDTARAKLIGLGNDGKAVAAIMGDANKSVKGTAFGLGEAASVAAAAVAAQIKPGEALQSHLKRIANNASAAGVSMQEMGSIFNKAATQANGVQNDVISQLADKGIPIYAELGKQMGVTAGEVFKMASEGKVDFETFSKAAEAAAGTVAEEMGKTVPGAFANLRASLGRIGANIFGGINDETGEMYGIYAKLGPLIASVTSAFGPLEERAKGIGAALEGTLGPALDWLTELFNKVGSGSEDLKSKFSGLAPLLAPIGAAFVALGSGGLAGILSRLPLVGGMLGGLAGPLAALGGPLGIAAAAFAGFALSGGDAGALVEGLTGIINQVVAALPGMVAKVAEFVPQLVTSILAQVPALLEAATGIVTALVAGLVQAVPMLIEGGLALIQGLITAIVTNLPAIIEGAILLVTALIEGIVTAIPLLVEGAIQLVTGLVTAIIAALPLIIEGGIQLLTALITGIIGALPMLLEAALSLVMGLLGAIIENLPLIIEAGIQLLLSLITGLINMLPQLITAAITLVLQLVTGLLKMLPQLITAGIELVVALIVGLVKAIPQIIQMLPQIVKAIWNGLKDVDWASLGMDIVWGIIDGLASMGGAIVGAITDLASAAFDGFKDFFGIASPAKRMKQPGRDVVRGAIVGVDDEASAFGDSLVAMANEGTRRAEAALSVRSTASSLEGALLQRQPDVASGAQVFAPFEVNVVERDPERVGRQIMRGLGVALGGI